MAVTSKFRHNCAFLETMYTIWQILNSEQCCEDLSDHNFVSVVTDTGDPCVKMDEILVEKTVLLL